MTGIEKDADHYNKVYRNEDGKTFEQYLVDPEKCIYLKLWKNILNCINKSERILDLGCGPGQFAQLTIRYGYQYYKGVDFSSQAILLAQKRNPEIEHKFIVDDLSQYEFPDPSEYDVVVLIEVMEHIIKDIQLLTSIPKGKHIVLSVPNYPFDGHVRIFPKIKDVHSRYDKYIKGITIPMASNRIFIVTGERI